MPENLPSRSQRHLEEDTTSGGSSGNRSEYSRRHKTLCALNIVNCGTEELQASTPLIARSFRLSNGNTFWPGPSSSGCVGLYSHSGVFHWVGDRDDQRKNDGCDLTSSGRPRLGGARHAMPLPGEWIPYGLLSARTRRPTPQAPQIPCPADGRATPASAQGRKTQSTPLSADRPRR